MEPSVSTTISVLGNRPRPSTETGLTSTSWMSSVNRRIWVYCSGAEYQRSNTAITQSA